MTAVAANPLWLKQGERSNPAMIKFMVWVALTLGRDAARALLYPICLYYLLSSRRARHASREFLGRALGRRPVFMELFRHIFFFGACLVDRIFFLRGQLSGFDVRVFGEDIVTAILDRGKGCFMLGAHFGNFEVVRAVGRTQPNLRVALLMYEENARMIGKVAAAINPNLATEIIALGRPESMLNLVDRLDAGAFIGILADRTIQAERQISCSFLGRNAPFPIGPFRLARILRRPILFMVGVYKGGSRYDIHFELLADTTDFGEAGAAIPYDQVLRTYVARLEHHARMAPYNWFNFYDIWE
jgi:predicted LPLAT superfamily acyltransferase